MCANIDFLEPLVRRLVGGLEAAGGAVISASPGLGSSLVGARDSARQLPRTDWT